MAKEAQQNEAPNPQKEKAKKMNAQQKASEDRIKELETIVAQAVHKKLTENGQYTVHEVNKALLKITYDFNQIGINQQYGDYKKSAVEADEAPVHKLDASKPQGKA